MRGGEPPFAIESKGQYQKPDGSRGVGDPLPLGVWCKYSLGGKGYQPGSGRGHNGKSKCLGNHSNYTKVAQAQIGWVRVEKHLVQGGPGIWGGGGHVVCAQR